MTRAVSVLGACVALGLAVAVAGGASTPEEGVPVAPDSAAQAGGTDPVAAGRNAPAPTLDSTLTDSTFAAWIERVLGSGARVRWEANDCGEATGSPSDSGRDLPTCAEVNAILSGGRDLTIRLLVGTVGRGVSSTPELHTASIDGPESSVVFHRLSEVERHLEQERPFLGNDSTYVDAKGNVHVITSAGRDVRLTREGPFRDPKLSSDGHLIGYLPVSVIDTGVEVPMPAEVATEVWIHQGGTVARKFEPGGFIRAWGFVGAGDSVAVYSGGLHFAGFYLLYDLASGEEIARSEDPMTDESPAWVRSLEPREAPSMGGRDGSH